MPKKKKKKKSKNNAIELLKSPKILIAAAVISVLILTYIVVESLDEKGLLSPEEIEQDLEPKMEIDQLSSDVFIFLNQFRETSNATGFELNEEAYTVAKKMAEMKGYDSNMFRRSEESNTFIDATGKLKDYEYYYPIIYEIEGPRRIEFENSFNKKYQLKRTILQERYSAAAAGCGEAYCVIILLGNETIELKKDYY
jgi:hypothetical protein